VYAVQTRNSHGVFQTIVPPWWNNILQSGDCSGLTSSSGIYDHFTVGTNAISSYAWSVQGE
jgi:hypothetical protein